MIVIKIYVPSYYNKFKCIADKCTDTCCAGWDVNFDPEDAEYYRSIGGEIGDKLRKHLAVDSDGDNIFTLTADRRCPFLDKRNLCELYIALGEDSLCPTCTMFPRFYDDFGSFREMGLGFGCPEAVRIILNSNEPFDLIEYGDNGENSFDVDDSALNLLIEARKQLFDILDNGKPFKAQAEDILKTASEIQLELNGEADTDSAADFNDCINLMAQMEYIDEERRTQLISFKDACADFSAYEDDFRKLLKYYIFRYMLKAVYDYDLLTKIKYGIFACTVIGRIYAKKKVLTQEDRIKIMCGYSKEVEYSDINTELLDNAMYEQFSCESLIELLRCFG